MDVPLVVGAVTLLLITSVILLSYTIQTANIWELRQWAQCLHILLPRFVTRRKWFQEWHYQAVWQYSRTMFWSECFPRDRHVYIDFGVGYHCRKCGRWLPFAKAGIMDEDIFRRALKWLL